MASRLVSLVLLVVLGLACGIKGPPRAPLDEPAPASAPAAQAPDAGCCGGAR